ncbi:hypothetical protein TCAL_13648, partial [Tigriopus californicus]
MTYLPLKSVSWKHFLLAPREWLNTPTSEELRALLNLAIGSHVLEETSKMINPSSRDIKSQYDLPSRSLPPLKINGEVLLQNEKTKRWDSAGTVMSMLPDGRSYIVKSNGSNQIR